MDEDIEITIGNEIYYLQVKTRSNQLQRKDIESTIIRFSKIRQEHLDGKRNGIPVFVIISNQEPSPRLKQYITTLNWNEVVQILTPSSKPHAFLPIPHWDLDSLIKACVDAANSIPFLAISASTLVFKLTAIIHHACTGTRSHSFHPKDVILLLEQIVQQLQEFPDLGFIYIAHENEPVVEENFKVLLISGFSGSGKTSWASHMAMHSSANMIYLDVNHLPAETAATSLSRELIARFVGTERILINEKAGIDLLRACSKVIQEKMIDVIIVLDNVHSIPADNIFTLISASHDLKYILLGQPFSEQSVLELKLGIKAKYFNGWSLDTIAELGKNQNIKIKIRTAENLKLLTGGLPLYVIGALSIIKNEYSGEADIFCDAMFSLSHTVSTPQEIILSKIFDTLNSKAKTVSAILGLCKIPLTNDEAMVLLEKGITNKTDAGTALRELKANSIIVNFSKNQIALHDAIRPLAAIYLLNFDKEVITIIKKCIVELLQKSINLERNVSRMNFLIKLLPEIGELATLVDLATNELFHEQGDILSLKFELENAANDECSSFANQYWAHDALAYWESRDGGIPSKIRLQKLREIIKKGNLGSKEMLGLCFKEMISESSLSNKTKVDKLFKHGQKLVVEGSQEHRLLRYNYAVALYRLEEFNFVLPILETLIKDYFILLGIQEDLVNFRGLEELVPFLNDDIKTDEVKRLGDVLNFWCNVRVDLGQSPLTRRILAMKFYCLAHAGRSAITAGFECVEDFIHIIKDPHFAKLTMETHVFPLIKEFELLDMVIEARGRYAVTLAWCGLANEANDELKKISNYVGDSSFPNFLNECFDKVGLITKIHKVSKTLKNKGS
ncbi:ATP-binding protein [Sphingobacterium detergens]|nr:ATP-binding protein [Sphingobacterium detergens]